MTIWRLLPARIAMTTLVPLPAKSFARFRDISITEYAEENVESGRWPAEGAEERSRQSYDELLTHGLATPNQHLFEMRDSAGAPVGTIWLAVIEQAGARIDAERLTDRLGKALRRLSEKDREMLLLYAWGDLGESGCSHDSIPSGQ